MIHSPRSGQKQASQIAHISLCPLNVDILVIPHSSPNENVNMVRWPVRTHVMQPLLGLPTPLCPVLAPLPTKLSWLQALIRALPSSGSNHYPRGCILSSHGTSLEKLFLPPPFPPPWGHIPHSIYPLCPESLCLCSYDRWSFSLPCEYFFDFCLFCRTFSSRG